MKSTRRALIKASLASPVVLSVTPAQGQTAASSALACIAKDRSRFTNPPLGQSAPTPLIAVDGDDWLRTRVDVFSFSATPSGGLSAAANYFVGYDNNFWQLILAPTGGGYAGVATTTSAAAALYLRAPPINGVPAIVYGLVYVNASGVVVGTSSFQSNGAAITGSCVASALPGGIALAGPLGGATDRRQSSSVTFRRKQ